MVTTNRHNPHKQKLFMNAGRASVDSECKEQGMEWGEAGLGEIYNGRTRNGSGSC